MINGLSDERHDFLHIVAHELRGAVNPLAAWAELLQQKPALHIAQALEAGDAISRSVQIVRRLASDLVEAGEDAAPGFAPAPLDLREPVLGAAGLFTRAATAKGVHLRARVARRPIIVKGDRARLTQIVTNLLDNALKFTERDGHVCIGVDVETSHARIVVKDTGIGMREEFVPRVFDRFTREELDPAPTPGRGLGLYIVRQLVRLHGGWVEAASGGRGLGSCFVVRIPLCESA